MAAAGGGVLAAVAGLLLAAAGVRVLLHAQGKDGVASFKSQFKKADASGARFALVACGVIGIVPAGRCALAEVARLARYLADESAGQCGPCVLGLPEVAAIAQELASGKARRRHLRRLLELAAEIDGRNACSHPDATLAMLRSATSGLPTELDRHLGGKGCGLIAEPALFATQAEQW